MEQDRLLRLVLRWLCRSFEMTTAFVSICLIALVMLPFVIWLVFSDQKAFWGFHRELKQRPQITFEDFYADGFEADGVSREIVAELLEIYSNRFRINPGLIRPHDNFFWHYDDDGLEFLEEIKDHFGINVDEKRVESLDGSFRSIANLIAADVKVCPTEL